MPDIRAIQVELRASRIDGWLLCDFLHRDSISYNVLGLSTGMAKRRWFYMIPARGEPRKLVHRIEPGMLDGLPGRRLLYAGFEELRAGLGKLLGKTKTVAMQYSPLNEIPYISTADAGTVELVRSHRKRVVSSAELVQKFDARWSDDQLVTHLQAGRILDRLMQQGFAQAAAFLRQGKPITEYELQQWIVEQFRANLVISSDPPIVAAGAHSSDPHYLPLPDASSPLREGELLLLDIWGRIRAPRSVYYDITWVGFLGGSVPAEYARVFSVVKQARDNAVAFVQKAVEQGRTIRGWQVDKVARDTIRKAGFGKAFLHRTGHSIGREVHGTGANLDSLESKDDRQIIPGTCFSVEPGIYLAEFGIRSEVNVYVADRQARVTGAIQEEIIPVLA